MYPLDDAAPGDLGARDGPQEDAIDPGGYEIEPDTLEPRQRWSERDDFGVARSRSPIPVSIVPYPDGEPGSIVISTRRHRLYLVQDDGTARSYGIGVGREGFQWRGTQTISRKAQWPSWTPPAEMRERQPELPERMEGGPSNPLGARALYLGDTLYRIHGTNEPRTIGRNVSSGCIRLTNADVIDLYNRVGIGTRVFVE